MEITLQVQRFDPDADEGPYLQNYRVEAEPTDRVLDVLIHVKDHIDGTLVFRRSCAHGVCGSDGMLINGRERLACKTLVRDVTHGDESTVKLEPLKHLPLLRDLIVGQDEFFDRWRRVQPFLIESNSPKEGERIQNQEQRSLFNDPTKCILCASCYSACPILEGKNPRFLGPAAIIQAARFLLDSRDEGLDERLGVLDHPDGVWACESHFECTLACPRGIKVTRSINLTKRMIRDRRD